MSDLKQTMETNQLREDLRIARLQVSMMTNLLDQIVVALEEDDYDEALSLAKGEE